MLWSRQLQHHEQEELHSLEIFLFDVQLVEDTHDRWKWTLHKFNLFTVSSCYTFVMSLMNHTHLGSDILEVLSDVWKIPVPSKVVVFCWRFFVNRLPTKENLIRRNVAIKIAGAVCVKELMKQ